MKEQLMKCGIYTIINIINNKKYYGSTTENFYKRWGSHRNNLNRNRHTNKHLQHAWDEYGPDKFEFKILLVCEQNECLYYEQLFLNKNWDKCIQCYNICPTAGNTFGRFMSEETAEKMRRNKRGVTPINNTSGYANIAVTPSNKYQVKICINSKLTHIRIYNTLEQAIAAKQEALEKINKGIEITRKLLKATNTSGATGIHWSNKQQKWVAEIAIGDGKKKHIGYYHTKSDAILARQEALSLFKNNEKIPSKQPLSSSGFVGVYLNKRTNRWSAEIKFNSKRYHLGAFSTPKEAAAAHKQALDDITSGRIPITTNRH